MCGHAARVVLNDPPTCTARWLARLSASASGKPAHRMMPALLTRMSMRPNCSTAVSTSAWRRPRRRHVVGVGDRGSARGDDLGRDHGRGLGVGADALHRAAEVVDDDAGAPLGEQVGMGAADPAAGARDDRDPSLEAVLAHRRRHAVVLTSHSLACADQYRRSPMAANRRRATNPNAARSGRRARRDRRHLGAGLRARRATTPPASPSCARSTVSARAPSTTTSGRRRSSSPRSTIA